MCTPLFQNRKASKTRCPGSRNSWQDSCQMHGCHGRQHRPPRDRPVRTEPGQGQSQDHGLRLAARFGNMRQTLVASGTHGKSRPSDQPLASLGISSASRRRHWDPGRAAVLPMPSWKLQTLLGSPRPSSALSECGRVAGRVQTLQYPPSSMYLGRGAARCLHQVCRARNCKFNC